MYDDDDDDDNDDDDDACISKRSWVRISLDVCPSLIVLYSHRSPL